MTPNDELLHTLKRIAVALETIAANGSFTAVNPGQSELTPEQFRARMVEAHNHELVTVDQVRATLDRSDLSNRAIGTLMRMAGFERRRFSEGVRYVIGEVNEGSPGRPLVMPTNMDQMIVEARKFPHNMVASKFLGICMRQEGMALRITAAHIDALHARYPGEFRDE